MNHAPPLRARWLVPIGLVLIGLVFVGVVFALRRMFAMSAPRCFAGYWHGCYDTENGVLLMTLVGVPLAALVAAVLAYVRGGWRNSVAEVGMVYGTVPWVWITLMPGANAGFAAGRVSLVPFADLITMAPLAIVGNLLVLASLGFFAPIRFAALASLPRVLALGVACSSAIELAQYLLPLDRVASVDDVLINAVGATLGGLASRRWWRTRTAQPDLRQTESCAY